MKTEEKISYLKVLFLTALADDTVDEGELQYFNNLGQLYGLSDEELSCIKETVLSKTESLEEIVAGITERSTKLTLLYDLLAVCYADNQYSVAEKNSLRSVCGLMGIETEKLDELEMVMEENVALQAKIATILERTGENYEA